MKDLKELEKDYETLRGSSNEHELKILRIKILLQKHFVEEIEYISDRLDDYSKNELRTALMALTDVSVIEEENE